MIATRAGTQPFLPQAGLRAISALLACCCQAWGGSLSGLPGLWVCPQAARCSCSFCAHPAQLPTPVNLERLHHTGLLSHYHAFLVTFAGQGRYACAEEVQLSPQLYAQGSKTTEANRNAAIYVQG